MPTKKSKPVHHTPDFTTVGSKPPAFERMFDRYVDLLREEIAKRRHAAAAESMTDKQVVDWGSYELPKPDQVMIELRAIASAVDESNG